MTAGSVTLDGSSATNVDLTTASTIVHGTSSRKQVGNTMLLWAGNVVRDSFLKYTGEGNDRDPILTAIGGVVPTSTAVGYSLSDVNMDGITKYTGADNDRDPILTNIGGTVPTSTRAEQLP
jgi:hypothetical protein